jgi:hypothetical protein
LRKPWFDDLEDGHAGILHANAESNVDVIDDGFDANFVWCGALLVVER